MVQQAQQPNPAQEQSRLVDNPVAPRPELKRRLVRQLVWPAKPAMNWEVLALRPELAC
jgi:hypothetical protein